MTGAGAIAAVMRRLNPRYCWLPDDFRRRALTVIDVGGDARDGYLAKLYLPNCRFTAINIQDLAAGSRYARHLEEFIHSDLDTDGLSGVAGRAFDYVICSHTIEHLKTGRDIIDGLAALVAEGGHLYLEWPSTRSRRFPVRGLGLNFHDDASHVSSFDLDEVRTQLGARGLTIIAAGPRRNWLRAVLAPLLVLKTAYRHRRVVLYDFWDWTGYADMVRAIRPVAGEQESAHPAR
jgi:hypothetical protein